MSWQQYCDALTESGSVSAVGIYDRQGNPWAYSPGFAAQVAEVKALADAAWGCPNCVAGHDCVGGHVRIRASDVRQRVCSEVCALLVGSTSNNEHPLNRLRGNPDLVDAIHKKSLQGALLEATPDADRAPPHDPAAQALAPLGVFVAGVYHLYICGDGPRGEFYGKKGAEGVFFV